MTDAGTLDSQRLATYVDVWWRSIDDFTLLLESLTEPEWALPTDLPGWSVHDVAAHTAHLEAILAGAPEETIEVPEAEHVRSAMGHYTEQGVLARREHSPDELINEIRESATTRRTALLTDPPTDPRGRPEPIFGGVPWDWETLLRNRPLDVAMHEQDIRRAVDRPGNTDAAGAVHSADYLLESMGFVLAKRAGAAEGTTLRVEVAGHAPVVFTVDPAGRGVAVDPTDPAVRPDATLSLDRETFLIGAGGRRRLTTDDLTVTGDAALAECVVAGLGVTP